MSLVEVLQSAVGTDDVRFEFQGEFSQKLSGTESQRVNVHLPDDDIPSQTQEIAEGQSSSTTYIEKIEQVFLAPQELL